MRPFGKKTIEFVTEERLMRAARFAVLFGLVLVAAASRLVPHPPNLTPIAAMALFGGAYFPDKRAAFLVPLAAMFLDRKSTRLNSSHVRISYAVFCLKKKKRLSLRSLD